MFKKIKTDYDSFIAKTYAPAPVAFVQGRGALLQDVNQKKYLDFISGLSVCNLGYSHPRVTRVIKQQAKKLLHVSNLFINVHQIELAKRLVGLAKLDKAFLCNSGTEANEAAIKFARHASLVKYKNEKRIEIICAQNSFHGRTLGSISATMQAAYQTGFGPLLSGFKSVPFNNIEALEKSITANTCALFLEPIQAEGGMNFPDAGYLKKVKALCKKHDLLLILDEVQVGIGRTGTFFCFEHEKIMPDILTLGKGLGSGISVGATLINKTIAQTLAPGFHASTFGGNPFAASVAVETIDIISDPAFLRDVQDKGIFLQELCLVLQKKFPQHIKNVQGLGLFAKIDFNETIDGPAFVRAALAKGLVTNVVKNHVIRLAPPLVISKTQIRQGMSLLSQLIQENVVGAIK